MKKFRLLIIHLTVPNRTVLSEPEASGRVPQFCESNRQREGIKSNTHTRNSLFEAFYSVRSNPAEKKRGKANLIGSHGSDRAAVLVKWVGFFQRTPSERIREFCAVALSRCGGAYGRREEAAAHLRLNEHSFRSLPVWPIGFLTASPSFRL
jgi:hypothetical protein